MKTKKNQVKECVYSVDGMHCASCEVLIEKKLIKKGNVEGADASTSRNEVRIVYKGEKPTVEKLNKLFKSDGYSFKVPMEKEDVNDTPLLQYEDGSLILNREKFSSLSFILGGLILIYLVYLFLNELGLSSLVSVNAASALPAFLLFGVIAGFSSCAALVGGIVLSMSKQWYELHSKSDSFSEKLEPHILFNVGRLVSFVLLGGVLGLIGSVFTMSPLFTAVIGTLVAVMMLTLGLQMLGVKAFQKFQFRAPKSLSRYIADESNFAGRYMPIVMGALTFFLPCGFTITAQGLAMASGDPIRGALIMGFFALGTAPMLLFIGVSSTKIYEKTKVAANFLKLIGILTVFFGLSTLNMQLTVLGLPSLNDLNVNSNTSAQLLDGNSGVKEDSKGDLPEIVNGKQVIKMNANSYGYSPNYFKVAAGVPVRWEIAAKNVSGCTNAIISKSLFDGQIALTNGTTAVKEFTPEKAGKYRFSCWMGMVTGIIEVVENSNPNAANGGQVDLVAAPSDDANLAPSLDSESDVIPSGASGCGCSGGSGTCGGSQ